MACHGDERIRASSMPSDDWKTTDTRSPPNTSFDTPFVLFAVGIAATEEMRSTVEAHVEVVREALTPWDAGRAYRNFAELSIGYGSALAMVLLALTLATSAVMFSLRRAR